MSKIIEINEQPGVYFPRTMFRGLEWKVDEEVEWIFMTKDKVMIRKKVPVTEK